MGSDIKKDLDVLRDISHILRESRSKLNRIDCKNCDNEVIFRYDTIDGLLIIINNDINDCINAWE